jgi:uncharacterized protein YjiS (DUF1127 family)
MTCTNVTTTLGQRIAHHKPALGSFRSLLARWGERRRQRRALAALDDRLLRDIGVAPRLALDEAAKPFWR